jgi:hypothetical protein
MIAYRTWRLATNSGERNGRTTTTARREANLTCTSVEWSGGERTRTADFYVANVALYQLSYTPEGTATLPTTGVGPEVDRSAAGGVAGRFEGGL